MNDQPNPNPLARPILRLGLAAALTLCSCRDSAPARSTFEAMKGASVLLITLDTTRADHLGCYGRALARTPAIDDLAANGALFKDASTQAPLTLVAHASLLTGAYPRQHGIHDNGRDALGTSIPTLAEIFSANGYETSAFVASIVLDRKFGLHRGFNHYSDNVGRVRPGAPSTEAQRPADLVTNDFLQWLSARTSDRPFFSWVHFYDPHKPYAPPSGFTPPGGNAYDGEIAFCDAQLKRILDDLAKRNLRERTLVVLTADHGESFGEHREEDHVMFLYETNLRIPLLFNFPGRIPAGASIDGVVRIADIAPTLLELFGWPIPPSMTGKSLAPVLNGNPLKPSPSFAESYTAFNSFGWAIQRSWTTDDWKYIDSTVPELFDRRKDPGERTNLCATHSELAHDLKQELEDFESGVQSGPSNPVALNPAQTAGLQSLGYLGGAASTSQPTTAPDTLPDPKVMYDIVLDSKRARSLMVARRFDEAIAVAEAAFQRCPRSSELIYTLGASHASLKRWEPAQYYLDIFVTNNPGSAPAHTTLGVALRNLGRIDESIHQLETALQIDSNYIEAHLMLGVSLVHAGRRLEGVSRVQAIVSRMPNNQRARQILQSLQSQSPQ